MDNVVVIVVLGFSHLSFFSTFFLFSLFSFSLSYSLFLLFFLLSFLFLPSLPDFSVSEGFLRKNGHTSLFRFLSILSILQRDLVDILGSSWSVRCAMAMPENDLRRMQSMLSWWKIIFLELFFSFFSFLTAGIYCISGTLFILINQDFSLLDLCYNHHSHLFRSP